MSERSTRGCVGGVGIYSNHAGNRPVHAVTPASIRATRSQVPVPRVGLGQERAIIDGILPPANHDVGRIIFGSDGIPYVTTGGVGSGHLGHRPATTPQQDASRTASGFPCCLRVLRRASVEEFDGKDSEQAVIMAKNCDSGDYNMKTCSVQVSQDMERFWEMGYVS